jgi:hypothetical protein
MPRTPFDPLQFLEQDLGLEIRLNSKGQIVADGFFLLPLERREQAENVMRIYHRLLLMQLDAPKRSMRPSVRKLLAQGKIEIVNRKYQAVITRERSSY